MSVSPSSSSRKRPRVASTPRRQPAAAAAAELFDTGDLALLDELLFTNSTPRRSRQNSPPARDKDFSPTLLAAWFNEEEEDGLAALASPEPALRLSQGTIDSVLVALRGAFPDRVLFEVMFSSALDAFTITSPTVGLVGHHLILSMDSADARDVYVASLQAGFNVRGRDMMAMLDVFARSFGVRRIHLLDAARTTLTAADGRAFEVNYSVLSALATGISYYNHFGYTAARGAEKMAKHNLALIDGRSFDAALRGLAPVEGGGSAVDAIVGFVDSSSALFGGHTARSSTTREIFKHLMETGALKKPELAEWISDTAKIFGQERGIRVPSPVEKTSFAVDGGGGKRKRRRRRMGGKRGGKSSTRRQRKRMMGERERAGIIIRNA
jgi:hypothetical protein